MESLKTNIIIHKKKMTAFLNEVMFDYEYELVSNNKITGTVTLKFEDVNNYHATANEFKDALRSVVNGVK